MRSAAAPGAAHAVRRARWEIVKLLGDARCAAARASALSAALGSLAAMLRGHGRAHAGVHAGPVSERDRSVRGTVNLASRIATREPGEVLTERDGRADLDHSGSVRAVARPSQRIARRRPV